MSETGRKVEFSWTRNKYDQIVEVILEQYPRCR